MPQHRVAISGPVATSGGQATQRYAASTRSRARGLGPTTPGYFKAVREICDRFGALLILDEAMCGMGRTGTLHAWKQEGVVPDIYTIAKGLVENVRQRGQDLERLLQERLGSYPNVGDIRGRGLFYAIELVPDRASGAQTPIRPGPAHHRPGRPPVEHARHCRWGPVGRTCCRSGKPSSSRSLRAPPRSDVVPVVRNTGQHRRCT